MVAGNGTWTVHLAAPIDANGYYFLTPPRPAQPPCRWLMEVDDGGGGGWVAVGASVWRTADSGGNGAVDLFPGLSSAAAMGAAAGTRVDVDHGAATLPATLSALVDVVLAMCMVCVVGAARVGQEEAVRPVFLGFLLAAALLAAGESVAWGFVVGDWRAATLAGLRIPAQATLWIGLALWESRLVPVLGAYAVVYTAMEAISAAALYGAPGGAALADALGSEYGGVAFAVALAALWLRRIVLARARRLVLADAAHYDALWAEVLAGEEALHSLADIRKQACTPFAPHSAKVHVDISLARSRSFIIPVCWRTGISIFSLAWAISARRCSVCRRALHVPPMCRRHARGSKSDASSTQAELFAEAGRNLPICRQCNRQMGEADVDISDSATGSRIVRGNGPAATATTTSTSSRDRAAEGTGPSRRWSERTPSTVARLFAPTDGLGGTGAAERLGVPGSIDPGSPVQSLDQLFSQVRRAGLAGGGWDC